MLDRLLGLPVQDRDWVVVGATPEDMLAAGFRPVGKDREQKSNFRLVAATNRDLKAMVEQGLFRGDLYFRLNTFNIHLPPLRERDRDIEKLVMNFVFTLCRRHRLPIKGVVPETLEVLSAYPWPGNVRELENTLEKAILADPTDPVLYPIHLPPEIRLSRIRARVCARGPEPEERATSTISPPLAYPETLLPFKEYRRRLTADIEHHYLTRLLKETGSDMGKACTVSGLGRSRLYDLLKIHGMSGTSDIRPE